MRTLARFPAAGVLALLLAPPLHAAFQDILVSPQAASMGGASLGNLEDSTAMFLNPAGIARLERGDCYFMYNQLYAGLSGVGSIGQGFLSTAVPTRIGAIGLGLGDFRGSGLLEERVLSLSYARPIYGPVQAGISAKYLYHNYLIGGDGLAAQDPVFQSGTSRSAFGLDAGLIARVREDLTAGIAWRNINRPNVGLASLDQVPRELQGGLAYEAKAIATRFTAELTYRENNYGGMFYKYLPSLGVQKTLADGKVRFRLGVNALQFSAGLGVQLGRLGVDYTVVMTRSLLSDNQGSHMVGMRYEFGGGSNPAAR